MGRVSREEAQRTRERIVQTAAGMFRASGVDQVSVADIMAALGLTTGGFYKHFASKEALAEEAMMLAFDQAARAWVDVAGSGANGTVGVGQIVHHYLRAKAAERRCPMIAFSPYAAADGGSAPRRAYKAGVDRLFDQFLRQTQQAGDTSARVLFAAMIGAQVLAEATGEKDWSDAVIDTLKKGQLR